MPIVAPTPNMDTWKSPIVLSSSLAPVSVPLSAAISGTGLRRKSCFRVMSLLDRGAERQRSAHPAVSHRRDGRHVIHPGRPGETPRGCPHCAVLGVAGQWGHNVASRMAGDISDALATLGEG